MPRAVIRSNRAEVSSRFPLLGFSVRTGASPYFEVAVATEPSLFSDKAKRTPSTFYSTRGLGPLAAESGEAIFLVPDQVLRRFVGQDRLYYAVATFPDRTRAKADVALLPNDTMPFVSISRSFSGRMLRQTVGTGARSNGGGDGDYASQNGASLEWAGDAARPGGEPVGPTVTTRNGAPNASQGSAPAAASALDYDDGYSDKLWTQERSGNAQSFDVGWADVPIVAQQANVPCVAAAAAMVLKWRDPASGDPVVIASTIGSLLSADGKVASDDYGRVASLLGLEAEDQQPYSVDAFRQLLQSRGPLFVTSRMPNDHAIVVTGIYGDGTPDGTYVRINDPWGRLAGAAGAPGGYNNTPGQGSQYVLTFRQFAVEYDSGATLPAASLQVMHVKASDMTGRVPLVTSQAFAYWQSIAKRKSAGGATAGSMALPLPAGASAISLPVTGTVGDISWSLDQFPSIKHPDSSLTNPTPFTTTTTPVKDWPTIENNLGDVIGADFEMTWQYNGRSLGNIVISNTSTNDAIGWGLDVKATITDDPVVHDGKAAMRVHFVYTFDRVIGSDIIAVTDFTLFADGTFMRNSRWTQGGPEAQSLGASNGGGRAVAPTRALVAPVVVPIASAIVGAVMTRVFNNEGDIKWELDQMRGMKYIGNDPANAGRGTPTWVTTPVEDWPYVENLATDGIYADFEIRWQFDGRSLGNVSITNTRTNDALGWGLDVKAQIMDDAAAYTRPGAADSFAAVQVQFYYRFNRIIASDIIAISDFTLYGDGTFSRKNRWTQT